ncbi:hypothetical protein [Paracidovorax konjaci]|uniref:hypothetical protein n=1 Tax=Paracidovorax konjaci TaxID=32040 RepID=UPI0011140AC2|nr:hypothetical protein [Paracidovorax konjaci]
MKTRSQRIYWWTVVGWLIVVCIHAAWSILQHRTQVPTDETYAQLLSFQIASFALTTFPFWLCALLATLVFEIAVLGRKAQ